MSLAFLVGPRRRGMTLTPGLLAFLGIATTLVVWEIVGRLTPPIVLVPPSAVLKAIPSLVAEARLPKMYANTMSLFLLSFVVSILLGVIVGLATAFDRRVSEMSAPILTMLYATPSIALIPLLVLWFGIDDVPKMVLVLLSTYFPVVINTQLGIRELGPDMRELGAAFGATRRELIVKVMLPAIIPHVMTAVRFALPRGFFALLAGEMLISVGGIGSLVLLYGRQFQMDAYFFTVGIVVLTNLGLLKLTDGLEHRLMPWRNDVNRSSKTT